MVTNSPAPDNEAPATDAPGASPRHAAALGSAGIGGALGEAPALDKIAGHFAIGLRTVVEPLLRRQAKVTAAAARVERFDAYLASRSGALSSFTPMAMPPLPGQALLAIDGVLILELVDLFFGGPGSAPNPLPQEFTPTADAMIARLVKGAIESLAAAWLELTELDFLPKRSIANPAMLTHLEAGELVLVTRFEIASADPRGAALDIVYPVSALKPIAGLLAPKVQSKRGGGADPAWLASLTRAVMNVKLPVRTVLAEPVIPLAQLMSLKPGDIIPISLQPEIPMLVADKSFARGVVGASNGRAAVKLHRIERLEDEDKQQWT